MSREWACSGRQRLHPRIPGRAGRRTPDPLSAPDAHRYARRANGAWSAVAERRRRPLNWALFLDFDGTLVDIAERPDAVVVDPGSCRGPVAGCRTRLGGALAIVSGRPIAFLDERLAPPRASTRPACTASSTASAAASRPAGPRTIRRLRVAIEGLEAIACRASGILSRTRAARSRSTGASRRTRPISPRDGARPGGSARTRLPHPVRQGGRGDPAGERRQGPGHRRPSSTRAALPRPPADLHRRRSHGRARLRGGQRPRRPLRPGRRGRDRRKGPDRQSGGAGSALSAWADGEPWATGVAA